MDELCSYNFRPMPQGKCLVAVIDQARTNDVTDLVMSVEKYVVNFPLPYLWHFVYTGFYFFLNVVRNVI